MSGLEVQVLEGLQLPPSSTSYGALTKEERVQREAQGGSLLEAVGEARVDDALDILESEPPEARYQLLHKFGDNGMNVIMVAAAGGNGRLLRNLLEGLQNKRAARLNMRTKSVIHVWGEQAAHKEVRQTAMHLAADRGHADCIKVLVDYGADVNLPDSEAPDMPQKRPLFEASRPAVKRRRTSHTHEVALTPIEYALARQHVEAVRVLLQSGAHIPEFTSGNPELQKCLKEERARRARGRQLDRPSHYATRLSVSLSRGSDDSPPSSPPTRPPSPANAPPANAGPAPPTHVKQPHGDESEEQQDPPVVLSVAQGGGAVVQAMPRFKIEIEEDSEVEDDFAPPPRQVPGQMERVVHGERGGQGLLSAPLPWRRWAPLLGSRVRDRARDTGAEATSKQPAKPCLAVEKGRVSSDVRSEDNGSDPEEADEAEQGMEQEEEEQEEEGSEEGSFFSLGPMEDGKRRGGEEETDDVRMEEAEKEGEEEAEKEADEEAMDEVAMEEAEEEGSRGTEEEAEEEGGQGTEEEDDDDDCHPEFASVEDMEEGDMVDLDDVEDGARSIASSHGIRQGPEEEEEEQGQGGPRGSEEPEADRVPISQAVGSATEGLASVAPPPPASSASSLSPSPSAAPTAPPSSSSSSSSAAAAATAVAPVVQAAPKPSLEPTFRMRVLSAVLEEAPSISRAAVLHNLAGSDKQAVKMLKVLESFEAADGPEDMAGDAAQCLIGQAAKGLYGPPPITAVDAEEAATVDDGSRRGVVQGVFEQPCSAARSRLIQMLVEGDGSSALARIMGHGLSLHPDNRAQGISCAVRMLHGLASAGYLGPIESTSIDSVPPYDETDFMNKVFERVLERADVPRTLHLAFGGRGADMLKRILDECIFHHRGNEPDATEAAVDMLFALQDCLGASKRPC